MGNLAYDVAHLLGASVLVLSFGLLFQRRILGVLNIFGVQAGFLAAAAAWQAYIQHAPHLYITAAIALVFKAIIIPLALRRIVFSLRIHRTVELVSTLRTERDAAVADAQKLRAELEDLRGQRKQARVRIEKLLGQMDLIAGR